MRKTIRLVAMSKMDGGGVCITGIDEETGRWLRPVKVTGGVSKVDLYDEDGELMQPLDLVSFDLVKRDTHPPHIEDRVTDFSKLVSIVRRPGDLARSKLLPSLCEASPDEVLFQKKRSLVLIEPTEILSASFAPDSWGKYKVRLSFSLDGRDYLGEANEPRYPVTDLRLRNWGRRFRTRREFSGRQLRSALGVDRIFLVMGLSRPYRGQCWPMVVGFHSVPDFEGEIDLDRP